VTSLAHIDTGSLLAGVWSVPDLTYLLHDGQIELRELARGSDRVTDVVLCARRWGKSWGAVVDTAEECVALDQLGMRDRFLLAAQTQKDAEGIIAPHMEDVLRDCPAKYKPRFNAQKLRWTWPHGSVVQLAGTDGKNRDRLRGRGARRVRVDEAGFHDDFEYLIRSVLLPQALRVRSRWMQHGYEHPSLARFGPPGKVTMLSTPSRSPEHPFMSKYVLEAEARGELRTKTIYDAPHITREAADLFIAESGGAESTDVRREYFCERVVDESRAIVPEFTRHRADLICDRPKPRYHRCYTIADFGFSDMTVVGFWEHHFDDDLLYQRDELVFRNASTATIAPAIAEREVELWGRASDERWGDPNSTASTAVRESEITINDFVEYHGQRWSACRRDRLHPAVNALRVSVGRGGMAWHPRCTTTIAHLGGGIWNASRSSFERSGEHGHFDGVAMAMYAERHIDRSRNPYPANPLTGHDDAFVRHDRLQEQQHGAVQALFGGKRR